MPQQLIPKEKPRTAPGVNSLFYIALLCLIAVFVFYFWFGLKNSAKRETVEEVKSERTALFTQEEKTSEQELLQTRQKINDFAKLITVHKFPSSFFETLEGFVHPKIQILNLTLNPEILTANLSGRAQSISVVGEQLVILQQNQLVEKVILTGPSLDEEGGVNFGLILTLKPEVFTGSSD